MSNRIDMHLAEKDLDRIIEKLNNSVKSSSDSTLIEKLKFFKLAHTLPERKTR